jgi:hypothetical protein
MQTHSTSPNEQRRVHASNDTGALCFKQRQRPANARTEVDQLADLLARAKTATQASRLTRWLVHLDNLQWHLLAPVKASR